MELYCWLEFDFQLASNSLQNFQSDLNEREKVPQGTPVQ